MDKEEHDLAVQGDLVLADGAILRSGWLGVKGEAITTISQNPLRANHIYDARDKLILPGFVDAHVHTRSSLNEGITATTRAAAAGGTTTVIDMPFDRPARPVRHVATFQEKVDDVNREAIIDVALYATFAPKGPLDALAGLAKAGACGFKVSTIQVDIDRFPRVPDGKLYEAFQEIAKLDLPVAAHQENQEIIEHTTARLRAAGLVNPIHHVHSRPPVAEAEAAGRLLELAYWTGVHLHMVHGTLPRTFDLIQWNKTQGVSASGETCIQYLLLTEEALRRIGGRAKCCPPLRTEVDVYTLWDYLQDRKIDIVTSDHSPYLLSKKDTPDIFDAYAGLPGAETLGPLLYSEGVARGRISLQTFVEVLASGPARIFGLPRKGRLAVGYDADFVVFDPDHTWHIDEQRLHHHMQWSPYHGRSVQGCVLATYLRGQPVFSKDRILAEPGTGRFVHPRLPSSNTTHLKRLENK